MRRSSALWVVGVVCVGVLAGCTRSHRQDTVQVKFIQPEGGKVSVMDAAKGGWTPPLTIPGFLDLRHEETFKVRLTDLPNEAGVVIYGRLTVERLSDYTIDCAVPVEVTRDDIEDAKRDVLVVKVVYLPNAENAVFAIPGAPTSIVSRRLEPGKDAVDEARRLGKVLLILRLGGRQYGQ